MNRRLAIALALVALPFSGRTEEPAKAPPKWYDTFELHGLVDTYFSANLDQAQSSPNALRVFDAANGFQLSFAKITAQMTPTGPFTPGFRADVGFGHTAAILNGTASYGLGPAIAPSPSGGIGSVAVEQAFVSLKLPGDALVDAGKVVTNAGAEVIEAKDNWLYSRSLLFGFAIPFTHTGLRATVPVPGVNGLSLMAALFNGWDNPPKQVGSEKTGHLGIIYSGPSNTTVVLNLLYGHNPFEPDNRLLLDGVLGRSFGDLSLNVNADYGKLGGASYWGLAAMARYSFAADKLRLSARGEILDDGDGLATGVANKYYEGTLGASIPVGANAELRLEGRHDFEKNDIFVGRNGQTTLQLAALAWF